MQVHWTWNCVPPDEKSSKFTKSTHRTVSGANDLSSHLDSGSVHIPPQ